MIYFGDPIFQILQCDPLQAGPLQNLNMVSRFNDNIVSILISCIGSKYFHHSINISLLFGRAYYSRLILNVSCSNLRINHLSSLSLFIKE